MPQHGSAFFFLSAALFAFSVHAKTASEVFEQVSASVVVVYGYDTKGKKQSLGSGVVIPGGDVATNCHVIDKSASTKVFYNGKGYPAKTRYIDSERDVCFLKPNGLKAPAVTLGSTKRLKVGARVYAIGAPKGLDLTLSDGIVSSLRDMGEGRYIQTTAPISPGSSGGGLFDEEGRLIGLPTFYMAEGQQLNFAVPVEWLAELPQRHQVAKSNETSPLVWWAKSVLLQSKRDFPAAVEHNRRWTEAMPESAFAWSELGVSYFADGLFNKQPNAFKNAIEAYQQTLRLDPDNADSWTMLGQCYGLIEETSKSVEAYEQAVRINPENAHAWHGLGLGYGLEGKTALAINAFQQELRINPEDASGWFYLGVTYKKAGELGKVMEVYRRLKVLDANKAEVFFKHIVLP